MCLDQTVWVEDPGYMGARGALSGAGARLVSVPVDGEGLDVTKGTEREPAARLACVTPSHQYPLGVTMSLGRRLELLGWANRSGAWVVEDDYDSEYRYTGRPLEALQGLDTEGRVLYVGTFSKVLFPALRLGYLVVPPDLIEAFVSARELTDRRRWIKPSSPILSPRATSCATSAGCAPSTPGGRRRWSSRRPASFRGCST